MKKLFIILMAIALCISAVSCGKSSDPEASMKEIQSEAEKLKGDVAGKWQISVPLSKALTMVDGTVWDSNIDGTYTVTFDFSADGKLKISTDTEKIISDLRSYFLSEEYSESAADAAAKIYSKSLAVGGELTYKFSVNIIKLSTGEELILSEDRKSLSLRPTESHKHENGENCALYIELLEYYNAERID